jgi:sec-independent protein translocase protein TatB
MFDLGWSELAFLAVLALIVVGPKDLPKLIHGVGKLVGRAQRFYRESMFSLRRLENEIDVASARKDGKPAYYDLLPDHVRNLVVAENIVTGDVATKNDAEQVRTDAENPAPVALVGVRAGGDRT